MTDFELIVVPNLHFSTLFQCLSYLGGIAVIWHSLLILARYNFPSKRFVAVLKTSVLIDAPDRPMHGSRSLLEALLQAWGPTIPLCGALRPMVCMFMEDRRKAEPSADNLKSSHHITHGSCSGCELYEVLFGPIFSSLTDRWEVSLWCSFKIHPSYKLKFMI